MVFVWGIVEFLNLEPLLLTVDSDGSPDYETATALIVTFTVNNHLNETDNRMAETWEKEFLKRLRNYNGSYINITYSAEVGLFSNLFNTI